jgi:hypothetical protein
MKIIDKAIDRRDQIIQDQSAAAANQALAVAAVIGGIQSTAWRDYMQQFASNSAQLSRLRATDGTLGDQTLDKKRAYLVGNGICGFPTGPTTAREVDSLDAGLPVDNQKDAPGCDPTHPRVLVLPAPAAAPAGPAPARPSSEPAPPVE